MWMMYAVNSKTLLVEQSAASGKVLRNIPIGPARLGGAIFLRCAVGQRERPRAVDPVRHQTTGNRRRKRHPDPASLAAAHQHRQRGQRVRLVSRTSRRPDAQPGVSICTPV